MVLNADGGLKNWVFGTQAGTVVRNRLVTASLIFASLFRASLKRIIIRRNSIKSHEIESMAPWGLAMIDPDQTIGMGQNCNPVLGAILKFIDDFEIGIEHDANMQHLVLKTQVLPSRQVPIWQDPASVPILIATAICSQSQE